MLFHAVRIVQMKSILLSQQNKSFALAVFVSSKTSCCAQCTVMYLLSSYTRCCFAALIASTCKKQSTKVVSWSAGSRRKTKRLFTSENWVSICSWVWWPRMTLSNRHYANSQTFSHTLCLSCVCGQKTGSWCKSQLLESQFTFQTWKHNVFGMWSKPDLWYLLTVL